MGGMQIIVIADFYQLPLVPNKWISDQSKYCFKSERWSIIILHKVVLKYFTDKLDTVISDE